MAFLSQAMKHAHNVQAAYKPNTGTATVTATERAASDDAQHMAANVKTVLLKRHCGLAFVLVIPAVSDWVERLCSSSYKVTEYEGIPELVESINLQHTG